MVMQSYEAIYDHGQMKWLKEKPDIGKARVIVTILTNEKGAVAGRRDAFNIHLIF